MMAPNIKDYIKIYDNFLDLDICKSSVEELESTATEWQMHAYYNVSKNQYEQFDKELSICYLNSEISKTINSKIWFAIEQYILNDFSYMNGWFNSWSGYTQVRFNRYNPATQMKLHCDHIHSMFDGNRKGVPILSVLGALNDDYEGGDLIMWETDKIKLKAGSIMIFPSNFMYPHRVDEVTLGTRYSYVSWVW
jgi:hypothetical protein